MHTKNKDSDKRDNNDVLIVYDDMSKHAIAVNTISNMVNQPLGATRSDAFTLVGTQCS